MPAERLRGVDRAWTALLSRRVEGETASEMRRHGETRRLGLYAYSGLGLQQDPRVFVADVRNRRLLLALYALGTNAGLKRVAAGVADVSIDELAHVHRRYIDAGALRAACARVTNATLAIVISDIIFGKPISNRGAGTCPGPSSACPTRTRHGSTAGRERSAYP